jgi:ATP synthase protein I
VSDSKLWKKMIVPAGVVAAASILLSGLLKGKSGFFGGLLASITVIIFFSIQLLVARISRDLDPTLTLLLAMLSYLLKVTIMGVFLYLIGKYTDRAAVDRTSFAISALVITMTWLVAEVRSFLKLRFQMPLPKSTSAKKGVSDEPR